MTCAIAMALMCDRDRLWPGKMKTWGVEILKYVRYMDDGRVFLPPIRCVKKMKILILILNR